MTEGRYFSLGGLFQTGPPQAGMPYALCPSKGKHAGAGQVFNEGVGNDGGGEWRGFEVNKVAEMCLSPRRHSSLPAAGRRRLESSGLFNPFPRSGNDNTKALCQQTGRNLNPSNTPYLPGFLGLRSRPACSRQARMTAK